MKYLAQCDVVFMSAVLILAATALALESDFFLVLDTEGNTPERMEEIQRIRAEGIEVYRTEGPEAFKTTDYADLIVIDGNSLEDIAIVADPDNNLSLIMKDGVIYKNTL